MAKIVNLGHHKPYGNCAMCGYCGTVQYHHIIPKRYKVRTDQKTTFVYADDNNMLRYTNNQVKVERLMLRLCVSCHKKLHPENWQFIMNNMAMEKEKHWNKEKELSEDLNSSND